MEVFSDSLRRRNIFIAACWREVLVFLLENEFVKGKIQQCQHSLLHLSHVHSNNNICNDS